MKKLLLLINLFLIFLNNVASANELLPTAELEVASDMYKIEKRTSYVASNLAFPYGLFFDNHDLLATTEQNLVRIELTKQQANGQFNIVPVAELAKGNALGLTKFGDYYVVLECRPGCVSTRLFSIAPDGSQTTLYETANEIVEVAVFQNKLLLTDITASELLHVDMKGNVSLFSNDPLLNGPAGIVVWGDSVMITNFNDGTLLRFNADGHASVFANELGTPVGIAWDGRDFIVADFGAISPDPGRILRVSRDGVVSIIAEGAYFGKPSGIALAGSDIYYTDIFSDKIRKIAAPRL